jgi:catechol 2,3-dioxygenase-like lactoylglutathione lyase family enzyme
MHRLFITVAALVLALASAAPSSAQLLAAQDGPIVYGHLHLNATPATIPLQKKFWADTLGGTLTTIGTQNLEIVKFPNILVFWRANQAPTAGSKGSTADHVGFSVPSLPAVLEKVRANGFGVITRDEVPATEVVTDGFVTRGATRLAFVMGPDAAKVELVENPKQTDPIRLHHMHFFTHQHEQMRAWYEKTFGARPRAGGGTFISADLPGVTLNFTPVAAPVAATTGRVYDHIGFEVKNLEEFTKQLEAQGITLTVTYRKIAALDTAIAFVTDPWGTSIELSDGLAKIR